jgi:hypothetical protein
MTIELYNDWGKVSAAAREKQKGPPPDLPDKIAAALDGFAPKILNVLCYKDVGYAWVQVVFDEVISPAIALRVAAILASAAGEEIVFFNSLRPRAVYFVFDLVLATNAPELPASRYGARVAEIRKAWRGAS